MNDTDIKQKTRPVYSELQGYLNQAPPVGEHGYFSTFDQTLWNQFNLTIEELNEVTGANFNKFKVTGIHQGNNGANIYVTEYRSKLGGLITRLHGTYFSNEPAPFHGMPSTSITVSNQQEQTQYQTIALEIHSFVEKKIATLPEGKEKSFLSELKEGLGDIKSFASLMLLIAKLGKEYGIGIDQLGILFS